MLYTGRACRIIPMAYGSAASAVGSWKLVETTEVVGVGLEKNGNFL